MSKRVLSPTSYIVLGMLSQAPGTPYDLKARAIVELTGQNGKRHDSHPRVANSCPKHGKHGHHGDGGGGYR
jgi:hypothetical protein